MYAVGIDVSDRTFTASCVTPAPTFDRIFFGQTLEQTEAGYQALLALLMAHHIPVSHLPVVMEATGVYSERLCYFLHAQGFTVYVEPPLSIHKAFYEREKTDPVDSGQIAEYYFRFGDRLHPWQPPDKIIDQVKTLLATREQFVKMQTASKNSRRSLTRKHHNVTRAQDVQDQFVERVDQWITDIEQEIETLIMTKPFMYQTYAYLKSIPGAGKLLPMNIFVITNGFTEYIKYQSLSKFIGTCPLEYQSGTSVYHRPSSDGAGSARFRKLLYLAAMRLRKDVPEFQRYFERKVAEGKPPKLIINNMANKLLKLICGVIKSGKPFLKEYHSVNPRLFEKKL
jgi:transposase